MLDVDAALTLHNFASMHQRLHWDSVAQKSHAHMKDFTDLIFAAKAVGIQNTQMKKFLRALSKFFQHIFQIPSWIFVQVKTAKTLLSCQSNGSAEVQKLTSWIVSNIEGQNPTTPATEELYNSKIFDWSTICKVEIHGRLLHAFMVHQEHVNLSNQW